MAADLNLLLHNSLFWRDYDCFVVSITTASVRQSLPVHPAVHIQASDTHGGTAPNLLSRTDTCFGGTSRFPCMAALAQDKHCCKPKSSFATRHERASHFHDQLL